MKEPHLTVQQLTDALKGQDARLIRYSLIDNKEPFTEEQVELFLSHNIPKVRWLGYSTAILTSDQILRALDDTEAENRLIAIRNIQCNNIHVQKALLDSDERVRNAARAAALRIDDTAYQIYPYVIDGDDWDRQGLLVIHPNFSGFPLSKLSCGVLTHICKNTNDIVILDMIMEVENNKLRIQENPVKFDNLHASYKRPLVALFVEAESRIGDKTK